MAPHWSRGAVHGWCPDKKTIWRQRHKGKTPCDNRGRDWGDIAGSQGTASTNSHSQKPGRSQEGSNPESQRERGSTDTVTLDFHPPDLKRVSFCCFKPQSLRYLSWLPGETKTMGNTEKPKKHKCTAQWISEKQVPTLEAAQTLTNPHPFPLSQRRLSPWLLTL